MTNKRTIVLTSLFALAVGMQAQKVYVKPLADNAVRIRYSKTEKGTLPDWIYVDNVNGHAECIGKKENDNAVRIDGLEKLFRHELCGDTARMCFETDGDECLYGLGQFQDGYNNVAGLPRRLTQVNTQISVPMLISSKGYGIIWNNYARTDFNTPENCVRLSNAGTGETETVNVTSTEGGKKETRQRQMFEGEITVEEDAYYALLLDVGGKMARRHNLRIDGEEVIEMQNLWLPPTASKIVFIKKGRHKLTAELTERDKPVLYYGKVKAETSFTSYPADAVDYTVIKGTPEDIIRTYRMLTGNAPLMPSWALGYIHCRERFHSQDEIRETADRFMAEGIPLDMIVQDWQYWGKNGWNSMVFDSVKYPKPKALTDYLHSKNIRMMLSVWSKIDRNSVVGREMAEGGYYIPGTDWVDFFNPDAAAAYWKNFREKLLPTGIDAWWQDATEPENDDLANRMVLSGTTEGNRVRNVYPMLVNKTVYEGLMKDKPGIRHMILTRSGFLGIQRYGASLWSGDIGNDWETLRRQITGGLGLQAAGVPWWTYDAGGFFRPSDQYKNQDYINRMLRWVEISVYLPLMRIHGYNSNTEPWNYGERAQKVITQCINKRKKLFPYIYSNAAEVAFNGSVLMRPLVFDFTDDKKALEQKYEYMFGKSLLVSPVTEPDVRVWTTYLPKNEGGWYDYVEGKHYDGAQDVKTVVDDSFIPVFAKAGSIVTENGITDQDIEIKVFGAADAEFSLYEDDGVSLDYEQGKCFRTLITWNDTAKTLSIKPADGKQGTAHKFMITVYGSDGNRKSKVVNYKGRELKTKFR